MSLLSKGNFNPEFLSVLSYKQDGAKKSKITAICQREVDLYQIRWNGFYWASTNCKNFKTRTLKSAYEIDWEDYKVKLLDTEEIENNK